jgi:hypothetical protein
MISLTFDNYMLERAKEKAVSLGSLNNSILQGAGNLAGYLGEEALASHTGAEIVSNNRGLDKYNHDLLMPTGQRVEVKTKRRTVAPRDYYGTPEEVLWAKEHLAMRVYARRRVLGESNPLGKRKN